MITFDSLLKTAVVIIAIKRSRALKNCVRIIRLSRLNSPFPSSSRSLFESELKCEVSFVVISSKFNMNEN